RLSQRNTETTMAESGFSNTDLAQALAARGHIFTETDEIGAATGIVSRPDGTLEAAAEPSRRGGGAAMVVNPL
ncbi:MAG: gamma-glutamyltransferase, partial [Leptolyngbya sp. SIO4C1]|nr:gamma-glutamyltransferase [Leptolyngbya sp. SIO4C1]